MEYLWITFSDYYLLSGTVNKNVDNFRWINVGFCVVFAAIWQVIHIFAVRCEYNIRSVFYKCINCGGITFRRNAQFLIIISPVQGITLSPRIISPTASTVIVPLFGFFIDCMYPSIVAFTSEYSKARSQFSVRQLIKVRFLQ